MRFPSRNLVLLYFEVWVGRKGKILVAEDMAARVQRRPKPLCQNVDRDFWVLEQRISLAAREQRQK
jgi:hypothetical protein